MAGPLKLGVIYTIAPYLLPDLVRQVITHSPQMPLMLQENFTVKLLEMLRSGEIDCAILAEPFPDTGLATAPLYDEPFFAAVPTSHPLAAQDSVTTEDLKKETMLLLGNGHCFRDHVLEVCPEFARFSSDAEGIRKSFEGSSLETIKHMVAAGMGIDAGATSERAQRGAGAAQAGCTSAVCEVPARARRQRSCHRRRAAWCWCGGEVSPATRPLRRCATLCMAANCRVSHVCLNFNG